MSVITKVREDPMLRSFVGGSLSASCSTILFQPLDLIKTRMQTSPSTATRQLLRQVGICGLWTGLGPSLLRTVPGVGVYFATVSGIRKHFPCDKPSRSQSALTGGLARAIAGFLLLPATVIKTRYESGKYSYTNIYSAFSQIIKKEGRVGLFSGLYPTLLRDVPFSSLYLLFYSELKSLLSNELLVGQVQGPLQSWTAGILAGVLASLVTHPADVVKTTQQVGQTDGVRSAANLLLKQRPAGTLALTVFYKGLLPRMLRRSLMSALAWTVYEEMNKKIVLKT